VIRRVLAALTVMASGCFAPAPLVTQAPSRYVLSVRDDVASSSDSAIAAVQRLGGSATVNTPATVIAIVRASVIRDSLWVANDTARVLVTGPWRRWLAAAEYDGLIQLPIDSTVDLASTQELGGLLSVTWGVDAVGARAAWAMGARGDGVTVASNDSGMDPHPGYILAGGYNAVTRSETGWGDTMPECRSHGMHVGGTMSDRTGRGVAPGSTVFGIQVFELIGGQCLSYASNQIAGINWAVSKGAACVNQSISGGPSYSVTQAVLAANARGTVVVRANGNSGAPPPQGTLPEIQTASVGGGLTRSNFSNPGPTTDLAAPGEGVESTMPGGYGTKSGTSMAAPHVCGVVALVKSIAPQLSADSMLALLQATALPLGSPTPNDNTGWGLVRADRAIAGLLGGVGIAAPATDTVLSAAPLPAQTCKPVVALGSWSASANVPWIRVTTTPDSLCYTIDSALVPGGMSTVTGTITTRSNP
jgi:subtilisin